MAKTVIGLYDDFTQARQVVDDLVKEGFSRDRISLVANDRNNRLSQELNMGRTDTGRSDTGTEAPEDAAKGAVTGGILGGIVGVVLGLGAFAIPGIGPAIAAGPIISGLVGAGVGAVGGGLLGALIGMGVPNEEAGYYAEGVRRGGTLVAVEAHENEVDHVSRVMNRHDPVDIEKRAAHWTETGWTGYDPDAPPDTHTTSEPYYESEHLRPAGERVTTTTTGTHAPHGEGHPAHVRRADTGAVRVHTYYEGQKPAGHSVRESDLETLVDPHGYSAHEDDFRRHFEQHYGKTGGAYGDYEHAYRFGSSLSNYRGRNWEEIEPEVRRRWETEHKDKGTWAKIKDSVRYGWSKL